MKHASGVAAACATIFVFVLMGAAFAFLGAKPDLADTGDEISLPRTSGRVAARLVYEVGNWDIPLTVAVHRGPECAGARRDVGDYYFPALFGGGPFKATVLGRAQGGDRRYLLAVEGAAADNCVAQVFATQVAMSDLIRQVRQSRKIIAEGEKPESVERISDQIATELGSVTESRR